MGKPHDLQKTAQDNLIKPLGMSKVFDIVDHMFFFTN